MDEFQVRTLAQALEQWEAEYKRTNPAAGRLYWIAQRLTEKGMPPLVFRFRPGVDRG